MNYKLNFIENKARHTVSVQLLHHHQVVMTGMVFFGDTNAEQYCSLSVQRPALVEDDMLAHLRGALVALTGNEQAAEAAFVAVLERAA